MKKLYYVFSFLLLVSISFTAFASNDYEDKTTESSQKMESNEIKVYPNPFSSTLNLELDWISSEITTVRIFNIIGKQIYLQSFDPNSFEIFIDTKTFEKGIYFVEVKNGSNKDTQRIIKK